MKPFKVSWEKPESQSTKPSSRIQFNPLVDNGSLEWTGGLIQELGGTEKEKQGVLETLQKTYEHMTGLDDEFLKANCKNQNAQCAFWGSIGECDKNPSYMTKSCAPACQSCHLLIWENRCPAKEDLEETAAYGPGDLGSLFKKIREGVFDEYGPVEILSDDPFVVTFENFLSDEECDALVELGYKIGYDRSTNTGPFDSFGNAERVVSNTRTSHNAWCKKEPCTSDPTALAIMERISNVSGTPDHSYHEHLQMLKYETGQFYKPHHDFIAKHLEYNIGPRVLTFFLYLSDVEEGGGTRFTKLDGLTVTPKKGKALLWPSVKELDPLSVDERTEHEAMSVISGQKYAANAWIHMYEYKSEHYKGCTG